MTSTHDDNRRDQTSRETIGADDLRRTPDRMNDYGDEAVRRGRRDEYLRGRDEYRHSDFRDDMHKDPNELEREADRARASIETTLEALERRLSPGELLDQMLHVVKDNGGMFGRNLATQVRNNPLPVLLTGIGMTWLIAASDRPPRRAEPGFGRGSPQGYGYEGAGDYASTGYVSGGESLGDKASSMASSASDKASAMGSAISSSASSAAEAARNAVGRAGEGARASADHARDAVHGMADSARDSARYARDSAMGAVHGLADSTRAGAETLWGSYDYLKREQPLVLGALAVAAGALLGSLIPGTRAEDRLMGQYSDEATERLKEEARQKADQARGAAAEAAEAARDAVQPKRASRTDSPGTAGESGSATGV
jgi:hypothetical protein